MPIDAVIIKDSPEAAQKALSLMSQDNMRTVRLTDFSQDANVGRPPDYLLHVFNIAPRKFVIARPPCFPSITFLPCPEGQPWAEVGRFPNIVNEKWTDGVTGEIRNNGILGERFLTDLLNPSNLGTNIWQEVTDESLLWVDAGGTNDYSRRGLFWSRNATPARTCTIHGGCEDAAVCPVCQRPTFDEIQLARHRLETFYKGLLRQADEYQRTGNTREIGMEHHLAGDYFRIKSPWHVVAELPSECPNCGEPIKEGVSFHINAVGKVCVKPTQEAWKNAVRAGVKTKSEIPEEFRWWQPPQRKAKSAAAVPNEG